MTILDCDKEKKLKVVRRASAVVVFVNDIFLFLFLLLLLAVTFLMIFLFVFREQSSKIVAEHMGNYIELALKKHFEAKIERVDLIFKDGSFGLAFGNTSLKNDVFFAVSENSEIFLNYKNLLRLDFAPSIKFENAEFELLYEVKSGEEGMQNVKRFNYEELFNSLSSFTPFNIIATNADIKAFGNQLYVNSLYGEITENGLLRRLGYGVRLDLFIRQEDEGGKAPPTFKVISNCTLYMAGFACVNDILDAGNPIIQQLLSFINISDEVAIENASVHSVRLALEADSSLRISSFKLDTFIEKAVVFVEKIFGKSKLDARNITLEAGMEKGVTDINFRLLLDGNKNLFGSAKIEENGEFELEAVVQNLTPKDISRYWPNKYLRETKKWLVESIKNAFVKEARVYTKYPLVKTEDLLIDVEFEGGRLHYAKNLPDVRNANGFVQVNNADEVTVNLTYGEAGDLKISKAQAKFNTVKDKLTLYAEAAATPAGVADFFMNSPKMKKVIGAYNKGDLLIKFKFETFTNRSDIRIFTDSVYSGEILMNAVTTPFFKSSSKVAFSKKAKSDETRIVFAPENTSLLGTCGHYSAASEMNLILKLDLANDVFAVRELNALGQDFILQGEFMLDMKLASPLKSMAFKRLKMCNTDLSMKYSPFAKSLHVEGERADINDFYNSRLFEFLSALQSPKKPVFAREGHEFAIDAQIKNVHLFNDVALQDFTLKKSENGWDLKSDKLSSVLDYENKKIFTVNTRNLGEIADGLIRNGVKDFKGGILKINGTIGKERKIAGSLTLENYALTLGGMDFGSKKLTSKFEYSGDILKIIDLRIKNVKNSLVVNGTINADTYALDLEALYTPSALDVVNNIPFFSNAMEFLTAGFTKDSFTTLTYDIKGTLSDPKVTFKAGKTSRTFLTKAAVITGGVILTNAIILPVLLILF